ncbi:MAG: TetR/AcrR family transcriptional regulator [Acidobacteriota bacterium]|nr:TetR/AcrR family transcriptional regulator [Acidobacteriota bacterium]
MSERTTAAEEKRRVILDAAVRVFARKGFHASRVGDIAEEAGVAHGLLYHYFSSKDEVLETIFSEHWTALLDRIHAVEASGDPPVRQLRGIVRSMFHGWRSDPDVVRVVIREIARSAEIGQRVGELVKPIGAIRRIFERGQAEGHFRRDLDADTAAVIVYGAIDELLTGWVLGRIPGEEEDVANAEHHIVEVLAAGLSASAEQLGEPRHADIPT